MAGADDDDVTGLLSYAAYNPSLPGNDSTPGKGLFGFYLFAWPTDLLWLYRAGPVHPGEQHRGSHLVVRRVFRRVRRVDAVADHRRLVAHRVHPPQQAREEIGVADVALDERVVAHPHRRRAVRLGE